MFDVFYNNWIIPVFEQWDLICDDVNFPRQMFPRSETHCGDYRLTQKWPFGPTVQANLICSFTECISREKSLQDSEGKEVVFISAACLRIVFKDKIPLQGVLWDKIQIEKLSWFLQQFICVKVIYKSCHFWGGVWKISPPLFLTQKSWNLNSLLWKTCISYLSWHLV